MVCYGMVWFGMVWYGMVKPSLQAVGDNGDVVEAGHQATSIGCRQATRPPP